MAESFNATIKKELIHLNTWPTLAKAKEAVFHYIEIYYNRKRPHTGIQNHRPYELDHESTRKIDSRLNEAA